MSSIVSGLKALVVALVASVMLILLGILYFTLMLFIIRMSTEFIGYTLDGNWAVITAGLITLGVLIGSALERRG
ncbi:MAG: hypothetical protein H3Z52_00150 [archaeon]|nr:hypothetical protein [archaeon]MCP8316819.1 hypothetical protein [archaeon]MCP8319345.1 hypothetical protein [archaeon]